MVDGESKENKYPNLVFLWTAKQKPTERDLERYGINYFNQKGYSCEIWSIHTKGGKNYQYTSKMYSGKLLRELGRQQYKHQVKKNRDSIFFVYSVLAAKDIYILAKNKCKYIFYDNLGLTRWIPLPRENSFKKKWMDIYYKNGIFKTLIIGCKAILYKLYKNLDNRVGKLMTPKKFPPLFIVASIKENDKSYPAYMDKSKKIYIHSMDYDRYVEEERKQSICDRKYILWIDSGWGFIGAQSIIKSYLAQDNIDMYNNRERYFKELNYLFEKMEAHYSMPVIIAGHPHTIYDRDMYHNREFYFGKTAELVKNAEFVMMNISTALSFTLLWNKKILMVCDDSFAETITWREWGTPTCEMLGLRPFNWDRQDMREKPWLYLQTIDTAKKKAYLDAYVDSNIPNTKNRLIVEIVEENIRKMCHESEIL